MLTFEQFSGINNVVPQYRLDGSAMLAAADVDIGLTGEVQRRGGFTEVASTCHKNLHNAHGYPAAGFMLATTGDALVAIHPGGAQHVIHPAMGPGRVWYCDLPDGRTTFSNGFQSGVTDGLVGRELSVRPPDSLGAVDDAFGGLNPGHYRYELTMRRQVDGVESPSIASAPFAVVSGGFRLDGLPQRDGHEVLVYLTTQDGEQAMLVGRASAGSFEWGGANSDITLLPCRTTGTQVMPVGTLTTVWRGRLLVAVGKAIWASRPGNPHLSEWRAFKQMQAPITMLQAVHGGVFVGTEKDLIWLGGDSWEGLVYRATERGPVVLGSGVSAPGKELGDGTNDGRAMVCIAGGEIVAGFGGGSTTSLTSNRYQTDVTEVCATFRVLAPAEGAKRGIPQYIAIPQ